MRPFLWCCMFLCVTQAVPAAPASTEEQLTRICDYLREGTPNQVAAARRQLWEEIGSAELDALRKFLARPLTPRALRELRSRLDSLLLSQLQLLEEKILFFGEARLEVQQLRAQIAQDSASQPRNPATDPEAAQETPDVADADPAGDEPAPKIENDEPTAEEKRRENLRKLGDLRAARENARSEITTLYQELLAHGLSLAPVAYARREEGSTTDPQVSRFHERLWEELVETAQRSYPEAPRPGAIPAVEERALIPLITSLEAADPGGWTEFREQVARRSFDLLATYSPEDVNEARQCFLELGDWGIERMDRWIAEKDERVPVLLRQQYAEWNRLGAPIQLAHETALPLARYRTSNDVDRQRLVYRLEWVAEKRAVPVLARLLRHETNLGLQVEIAGALARLSDPRGAAFLRQLGLQNSIELESVSRKVLLIEAIHRRESGDVNGALAELQELLRRFPNDFRVQYETGYTALLARQLEVSIRHFLRATELDPTDRLAHYNLACAYALAGQSRAALQFLKSSVRLGFDDGSHMANDSDLESLRGLPEFQDLLQQLRR